MAYKKKFFYSLFVFTLVSCTPVVKPPHLSETDNQSSLNDLLNQLDPNTKTINQAFLKAKEALSKGNDSRALFYYVKVIQLDNKNVRAMQEIAIIYKKQKKNQLVEKIYHDIIAIDHNNSTANEYLGLKKLENRELSLAKKHLTIAINSNSTQWQSHNGLGVIADLEKNYPTAIHHYSEALKIKPTNFMLLNNVGYSHYLNANETAAKKYYNQVLSLNNKHQRAIFNLALIQIKNRQYKSAVSLFDRIMKPYESFNNIGYVCMLDGQFNSAELYFNKAITESPYYFPQAQINLKHLNTLRFQTNTNEPHLNRPVTYVKPKKKVFKRRTLKTPKALKKIAVKKAPAPIIVQENKQLSITNKDQKKEPFVIPDTKVVALPVTNIKSTPELVKSRILEDSTQPNAQTVTKELSKTENIIVEEKTSIEKSTSINNTSSESATGITSYTDTKQKAEIPVPVIERNELNSFQQDLVPSKSSTSKDLDLKGIQLVVEKIQITAPPITSTEINPEHKLKKTAPEVLKKESEMVIERPIENTNTSIPESLKNTSATIAIDLPETKSDVDQQSEKIVSIPENKKIEAITGANKNSAQSSESIQDDIEGTTLTPLLLLDLDKYSPSKEEVVNNIPSPSLPLEKADDMINQ